MRPRVRLLLDHRRGELTTTRAAATKDDLVDMIQHGAERIINNADSMLAQADDIDDIISRGEERTKELNAKYQGLDFDDLANFKTETSGTQQWEGQDYAAARAAGKPFLGLKWIEPPKRERKMNYSENVSFRDLMRGGPPAPKKKRPKKLDTSVPRLLSERVKRLTEARAGSTGSSSRRGSWSCRKRPIWLTRCADLCAHRWRLRQRLSPQLRAQKANGIKAEMPEPDDSEKVDAEELERQRQEMQAEIDNGGSPWPQPWQ